MILSHNKFIFCLIVWLNPSSCAAWLPLTSSRRTHSKASTSSSRVRAATAATSLSTTTELPELMFFNSKSRSKEPLKPIASPKVSMYTCGPTVYDYAHVGNFRAFLTYDLIKRALLYFGYTVDHVCNLTDVDDKIIQRANERGIQNVMELTRKFEDLFMEDLKALNVIPAGNYPRATEHIPEMMEMILGLGKKGLAYETEDGSWYFATNKKEGYGQQLVDLNWDEMETSERGEGDMKRNPQDFCLWKAFKPESDREDSVWESDMIQKGRPGWHLECSAMARKYLGDTIDIHGGGIDLKFPHHENEIAQSEGFTGQTFCNCWMHNGFVNINDEKMSKSLGNFLTLRIACPEPEQVRAYRYLVISSQYRNPLNFSPDVMMAAQKTLNRIDKVMDQLRVALSSSSSSSTEASEPAVDENGSELALMIVPKALSSFDEALLDDLSMPRASAALFNIIKAVEKEFKTQAKDTSYALDMIGLKAAQNALLQMDKIFGIFYIVPSTKEEEEDSPMTKKDVVGTREIPGEVMDLVAQRTQAKESKDWELADSLRARITELGFAVKDVKNGEPQISRIS